MERKNNQLNLRIICYSLDDVAENGSEQKRLTPEERELLKKRAELPPLETSVAKRELDLTRLRADLQIFEGRYRKFVAARYAELYEIEAQIAEENSRLNPDDEELQAEARRARSQAKESAGEQAIDEEALKSCGKFQPSESLKKLYRDLARRIHPDTVLHRDEKERRHLLMARVNLAYENSDERLLQNMLDDWARSPEGVKGEGAAAELVRVIRRLAKAEERLKTVEADIKALEESEAYQLKVKADEAEKMGRDMLAELGSRVDTQVKEAKRRLEDLLRTGINV